MNLQEVSFHEATVTAFYTCGDMVYLNLADVKSGDSCRVATITISGVTRLLKDRQEVEVISAEHQDGEVLTLEIGTSDLYVIVQWNDFEKHQSKTHSYLVEGASADVSFV